MKEKRNRALFTIVGGIESFAVVGVIMFVVGFFFLLHKGYFPIPESKDYIWMFTVGGGMGLIIILVHLLLRKRYKHFSRGILFSLVVVLALLIYSTIDLIWFLTPEPFEQEVWKSGSDKSLEMVYSLIRDESILVGKTRNEAVDLLGSDFIEQYTDKTRLTYHIDVNRITFFQLSFNESGTVERAYYLYYD